jgi:hypothetical protein
VTSRGDETGTRHRVKEGTEQRRLEARRRSFGTVGYWRDGGRKSNPYLALIMEADW